MKRKILLPLTLLLRRPDGRKRAVTTRDAQSWLGNRRTTQM
jgi:hypothetical protein